MGSLETTREAFFSHFDFSLQDPSALVLSIKNSSTSIASFNFFDFYKNIVAQQNASACTPTFLSWFIGFVEADGYYSSRFDSENIIMDDDEPTQVEWNIDPAEKRGDFEITQKNSQVLYKIQNILGFGSVIQLTKNGRIYYRFCTSKKEHILRLVTIFNGNLVLKKRRCQFENLLQNINIIWNSNISVKPWEAKPSLNDGWLSGFSERDGGFYTNLGNDFKRGKYDDGRTRYGFYLKFYITQKGEDETLLYIRDLFKATNQLYTIRKIYSRLEITNILSRILIIDYFNKF